MARNSNDEDSYSGFLAASDEKLYFYNVTSKVLSEIQTFKSDRSHSSAVRLNNELYVISGYHTYSVVKISLNDMTSGWIEVASTNQFREAAASAVCNGFIYTVGGCPDSPSSIYSYFFFSLMIIFPCVLCMPTCGGASALSSCERYDPQSNIWSSIKNMNEPRRNHALVSLKGKLYVIGGFNLDKEQLDTAECYHPSENVWKKISSMQSRRYGLAAVALNNEIYAIGGFDGDDKLASVEKYSPITDTWSSVASLHRARFDHSACVIGKKIYVGGGGSKALEVYNPTENIWEIEEYSEEMQYLDNFVII